MRTHLGSRVRGLALVAAVLALAGSLSAATPQRTAATTRRAAVCAKLFVPAFFWPGPQWNEMVAAAPPIIIFAAASTGAGTSPEPTLQAAVRRARRAGITVLGYTSTQYGRRPVAEIEADVRHYRAWYDVTGIFFDETSSKADELGFYRTISHYVRHRNHGAPIWFNPGDYPPRAYMRLANVLMTFEGPSSGYGSITVPSWTRSYSPLRFAHNIYDTPASTWRSDLALARSRRAGWVYVTDGTGANPYGELPSYFSAEATTDAGCTA